jgi:hypothetical protein
MVSGDDGEQTMDAEGCAAHAPRARAMAKPTARAGLT